MSRSLYENHWGSPTLTLLNVLGVLGVLNVLHVLNVRDITRRNMAMLTDEDIDEAGRRLCSSGADMQSRSTLGDRSLTNLPKVPVDRLYCHQSSTN